MEGHDSWRAAEARSLSDLVQKRFHHLQNPKDCSKAKKLVCNLNKVHFYITFHFPFIIIVFFTFFRVAGMDAKFITLLTAS